MKSQQQSTTPKPGVGVLVNAALKAGKTNEEILEEVQKKLPGQHTTIASISWYRNKARQNNKSIPTARAVKRKRAKSKNGNGSSRH